jgi:peptidoglycan/xylan/chitin deacetylase (PgdA/CDA1 family)
MAARLSARNSVLFTICLCLCLPGLPAAEPGQSLILEHGPRNSSEVALTFDACPTDLPDEYDGQVIDVLLREEAPATLFLSGRWVEKNPEQARRLAGYEQFELAAHSYSHPHLLEKDDERVLREMERTQAIIKKTTGGTPRYFRAPYGEVDERVARLAKKAGLATIQYDLASGDPDPGLSARKITNALLRNARGGSILVFHMNRKGAHTAELLPELIRGLREKGLRLVTVGEMLKSRGTEKGESKK